jgi:hypothetical protein
LRFPTFIEKIRSSPHSRGHTKVSFEMSTNANHPLAARRDTRAWIVQVWISFAMAVFLCGTALAYLPGQDLDRAFMVMGYVFCLTTTFVLSKFVRDNQYTNTDTPMWRFVVYGAFVFAMTLTAWGLWRMNVNETYKAFLLVGWLYLITTTFTLAKTLRDAHEANVAEMKLAARAEARAEVRSESTVEPMIRAAK